MKRIITSLIILISLNGLAQPSSITLGSDVWPPFTNVDGEEAVALDLVKEALNRIEIQSSFEIVNFNEVISGIDTRRFDGSAALWLSKEREEKYFFSKAYLHNQLILVGRKGSIVKGLSFSDLKEKRIGIVESYDYGQEINPQGDILYVKSKSDQKNLEQLLSKQIDYMVVDALLIQHMLNFQINDVSKYLEIGDTPIIVKSLHFALRKDIKDGKLIIDQFDEEIAKMIADGSYNQILNLNWIKSDIDGDGNVELVLKGNQAGTYQPANLYSVVLNQSNTPAMNTSYQYYIDGNIYDTWENIPDRYKVKFSPGKANPNNIGLVFNF